MRRVLLVLAALVALTAVALGQTPGPSQQASPSPQPEPTPVPLTALAGELEDAFQELARTASAEPELERLSLEVGSLAEEARAYAREQERDLAAHPTLDVLQEWHSRWRAWHERLQRVNRDLTRLAGELDSRVRALNWEHQTWTRTLEEARGAAPPELVLRLDDLLRQLLQARRQSESERSQVLSLLGDAARSESQAILADDAVTAAQAEVVNRIGDQDSAPIWSSELRGELGLPMLSGAAASLRAQATSLVAYLKGHASSMLAHALVIGVLMLLLVRASRRVAPWVAAEPALKPTAQVFATPIATGFVLSILAAGALDLYPQPPRLLAALAGAASLLPAILVLRRLIEPRLFRAFSPLVLFSLTDLVRSALGPASLLGRLVFMLEMGAGSLYFLWLYRQLARPESPDDETGTPGWVSLGLQLAVGTFTLALLAAASGFTSLAYLAGGTALQSAYIAVVLYAVVRIAEGLVLLALRSYPLKLVRGIQVQRPLIRRRLGTVVRLLALLAWVLSTLELLSARRRVLDSVGKWLAAPLPGASTLSVGDLLVALACVYVAVLASRAARFFLREDVYPRVVLPEGIPYALSMLLHYALLLVGLLIAVGALGVGVTQLAVLFGALGVGLGFGLQNIANNFVSGLILLFERPVKLGDLISVGDLLGDLRAIGLRASVVRTPDGSEVLVPNGDLISQRVVNWTLSDPLRRLDVNVGVAYGTDRRAVVRLLTATAAAQPDIVQDPGCETLFVGFGASSLDFQVRAWTASSRWVQVRSDLALALGDALDEAGIEIPFPQRTVRLVASPGSAAPADSGSSESSS